jgi:mannose-6-phosphate isomerase-like protein (cupin superfamily)
MLVRLGRSLLARGGETLLALGLVLVSFFVFMGILSLSFPRGTNLVDLMRLGEGAAGEDGEAGTEIGAEQAGGGPAVALLSHLRRDVKDRAADAIAWSPSRQDMPLGDRHAVQTFDRSGATITFSEGTELTLQENTLVVLKKAEALTPNKRRLASLIVVGGELRGTLAVARDAPVQLEIEAATRSASIHSSAGPGAPAEFSVSVNEDASSTFTVFQGTAEVSSGQGTVAVAPNHSVTVDPAGTLGAPRELPPPPVLRSPENDARLDFRTTRSRIRFAWEGTAAGDGYLLTVARDPRFHDVVESEVLSSPEFMRGNLRAGSYYWRVSTRRAGLQGASSPARQFRIARDVVEPSLRVEFPGRVVSGREIVLTGSAEPSTKVFVNNVEIRLDASGRFSHALTLERGVNMVVVEAIDAAGNVAYRSETIDARY